MVSNYRELLGWCRSLEGLLTITKYDRPHLTHQERGGLLSWVRPGAFKIKATWGYDLVVRCDGCRQEYVERPWRMAREGG